MTTKMFFGWIVLALLPVAALASPASSNHLPSSHQAAGKLSSSATLHFKIVIPEHVGIAPASASNRGHSNGGLTCVSNKKGLAGRSSCQSVTHQEWVQSSDGSAPRAISVVTVYQL